MGWAPARPHARRSPLVAWRSGRTVDAAQVYEVSSVEICQKHLSLHTEHYGFTALVPAFLDMLQGGNIGETIVNVARRG
jgi:hypothetical protein